MMGLKKPEKQRSTSSSRHLETGKTGEAVALHTLKRRGYTIIKKNHRTKLGEIDIIAEQGGALAFIEVKARRSYRFGSPKLAVTMQKQRKISMVALEYLKATGQTDRKARFDVVAVHLGPHIPPDVEIIQNAFDLAY